MSDTDNGGKAPDSPTGDTTDQGASTTDQTTDAKVDGTTDQTGQKAVDSQTTDTGTTDQGDKSQTDKEKPPPYDQDPKWKAARAAEKRVNEILEKYGYDSIDDLEAATDKGYTLSELLGNRDANELISEYEEFQRVKKYWAEQKATQQKANETPEETIERLEREKRELEDGIQRDQDNRNAQAENQRIMTEFDNGIRKTVNALEKVTDIEKSMLIEFLGVDNEAAIVNPADPAASKRAIGASIKRFTQYISDVKQKAVEDYIAGKSDIMPIKSTDTSAKSDAVKTEREPLKPGTTPAEAFSQAKSVLMDRLTKLKNAL